MCKIKPILRKIIYSIPGAKKMRQRLNRFLGQEPDFSGWGMITYTFTPWHDGGGGELTKHFIKAHQQIVDEVLNGKIKLSQFESEGNEKDVLESLMWRHYILYWTAWYASKSTSSITKNLVECGVCDGLSVSFAMHAIMGKYEFKERKF